MFKKITIPVILLTVVLAAGNACCQEDLGHQPIIAVLGKVTKMDGDSGVVTLETGAVSKNAFSDAHLDAGLLWDELIKSGYIDANGTIQTPFYALNKFSEILLPKKFNSKKKLIYNIFQKALTDNGKMLFYISINSDLLQGTHHITSVEIEQGDPVEIQYARSPDKNNVIRLVDNKSADGSN